VGKHGADFLPRHRENKTFHVCSGEFCGGFSFGFRVCWAQVCLSINSRDGSAPEVLPGRVIARSKGLANSPLELHHNVECPSAGSEHERRPGRARGFEGGCKSHEKIVPGVVANSSDVSRGRRECTVIPRAVPDHHHHTSVSTPRQQFGTGLQWPNHAPIGHQRIHGAESERERRDQVPADFRR